ncbi:MAG: hypothetical protein EON58_18240 [Alphaproteobacteria bacterium]|nr:MAG: hypothetical protein EON58_18240 [Alphaproteobacteria bacterium]
MTIKLFHYTATSMGEAILSSSISRGHLKHADGSIRQDLVWFTTDPEPDRHGLTLGTEKLSAQAIAWQERLAQAPLRNARTLNKTEMRLTVDFEESNPWLMSFVEYANRRNEPKQYLRAMGLSCIADETTPRKEYERLRRTAITKENTWWLYFGAVQAGRISAVDFNVAGRFEAYDFETHGRSAMRRYGFVFPSATALQEVADLIPSIHPLERPKAFVFCEGSPRSHYVLNQQR